MVGGFLLIIWGGHVPIMVMTGVIVLFVFKEIMNIGYGIRDKKPPSWWLQWYFFAATVFLVYGRAIQSQLVASFGYEYHLIGGFGLLIAGLVMEVLSLRPQYYRPQIRHFARILVGLILTVVQCGTMVFNLFQGMIWFLLPVSLVIVNDITAYLFGFFFGRTRLVKVSPKKTWEGFIGALFCTIIFAFFFVWALSSSEALVCPKSDLSLSSPACVIDQLHGAVFMPKVWQLPRLLRVFGLPATLTFAPAYIHALAIAVFTSLLAPFGGFLASGVKRAFKIKDFGEVIPGHGGVTDRMDCQFLAGTFTFAWLLTFVLRRRTPVQAVVERLSQLHPDQLQEVARYLAGHPQLQRVLCAGAAALGL